MMSTPYHVRLAVTQYGEQFRAELFTEDLGDTEGDLLTELPPSLAEWVPYLAQGADLPPDAARQLGKDLFAALLGQAENAKKWSEVLAQADRKGQTIRLLIDATTDSVRDLPFGLLCEPHDDWFLFRGGRKQSVAFVRILRRCSPRPLKLNARLRVLVAVAEPKSADVPPFDAALQLQKMCAALYEQVEVVLCGPDGPRPLSAVASDPRTADAAVFAPYTMTTRSALRAALAGDYDVFHLLAHGHGAGVLLCNPDHTPAETTASELAAWCGAGRTPLAFLQVCKAGSTFGRGGFGGVAQQLLSPRGGNLAAVVASTFPLDAGHSTDAALGFYRQLAAGKAPEHALTADRAEGDWCWAFLELWARPGALGGTQQRAAFQFVSPYRGLSSFGEQDADLFFGRKAEVNELLQLLRTDPVVAVVGDSGSGKSSLLQAGLVHAIRQNGLAGLDRWRIVALRPGYRPAHATLAALRDSPSEPTPESLRAALRADAQPLMLIIDQFEELFTLARDRNEVPLLTTALADAVEQQPDRFRLVIGMRSEFLGQAASVAGLSRLIRRPWVLRPPGMGNLRDIVAGPAENCGYTFQGPLADGDPRHATALLDRVLADPLLAGNASDGTRTAAPLPLLQFALERLWLRAVEKGVTEFTHAEFDAVGGMGKAIAQHAEAVFQSAPTATGLGANARALVEQLVTALISPQGTRQPRVRADVQAECGDPDAARAVVDYLVGERLLTVRSDPEDLTRSLVDLSHEALILHWDRLRGWLAEDPQGRAMREEFRRAAEQWDAGFAGVPARSRYGLPGADVAANYLAWIRTAQPRLAPVQQEFATALSAMLARQRRVRRMVMGALAGLAVAASLLAINAHLLGHQAQKSADAARESEDRALKSADAARESEDRALKSADAAHESEDRALKGERLARERSASLTLDEGIRLCEKGQPRIGLLSIAHALEICPAEATDLRRVIRTNLAAWAPLATRTDEVRRLSGSAIAASSDGEVVLISVGNNSLQLVEMDSDRKIGAPFELGPHAGLWARVVKKGDEWRVLTFGPKIAQLWNANTGKQLASFGAAAFAGNKDHTIFNAALGPDGQTAATAMSSGEVWIWDARTGAAVGPPLRHEGGVADLTFTPDGAMLLTGCARLPDVPLLAGFVPERKAEAVEKATGLVRLWNLASREVVWADRSPDPVTFVGVSPDPTGRFLSFGGFEVRMWDRKEHRYIDQRIREPESGLWAVFDPAEEGKFLVARPSGHVDIYYPLHLQQFAGERLSAQGWITGVGFRARDRALFTVNNDGTVRIWRTPPSRARAEREYAHPREVLSVAFGPADETFVSGCADGSVYLWATAEPAGHKHRFVPPPLPNPSGRPLPVTQVAVSDDGTRIVAQDLFFRTLVWEVPTGKFVTPPEGDLVGAADDGVTVLVRLPDRRFRVRNLRTGAAGKPFAVPEGIGPDLYECIDDGYLLRVKRAAFSPDRTLVALITEKGGAEIHRVDTGEQIGITLGNVFNGKKEGIRAVDFSPDGTRFLVQSNHGYAIFPIAPPWSEDCSVINRVGVQWVRFSPCGQLAVSALNFNMAQLWDVREKRYRPFALAHSAPLWGAAVSGDRDRVLTASQDHTARAWDVSTGKPLSPPLKHDESVSEVRVSRDGKRFLTSGADRRVRLWRAPEPIADDVERVTAWVETLTGMRIGLTGSSELLIAEEWAERKKRLEELGGPP